MKYGFIGAGRMGSALVKALVERKIVSASDISASDLLDERLAELGGLGVSTTENNAVLANGADVLFLCVKPQNMGAVLDEIMGVCEGKLVVSIAAGVTTGFIEKKLSGARVIRVMPNTPSLVGELAAGYCAGKNASEEDVELVGDLMRSIGTAVQVPEELMDAVTGLSGSGPAYVYYLIDALAKAGVKQGLPEKDALALSAKTVKGAAEMLLSTGKSPQELIDMVCSPGGTTIEGMKVIEESDVKDVLAKTVKAAADKSRKLSK